MASTTADSIGTWERRMRLRDNFHFLIIVTALTAALGTFGAIAMEFLR